MELTSAQYAGTATYAELARRGSRTSELTAKRSMECASPHSRPPNPVRGTKETKKPRRGGARGGAYGIRARAAAVRVRCPRPLDECAGGFSVDGAGQNRSHARKMAQTR